MIHILAKHRATLMFLAIFTLCALALHLFYLGLPSLNSDEIAHGYNAYSVLKTGRGEFGELPIRFASFGENKLPITGFLMIPGIALFGLHDWVIRLPTHIMGVSFPILFFVLATLLTRSKKVGLLSALFAATSPWLQVTSRHAHEGIVCLWFIMIGSIVSIRYVQTKSVRYLIVAGIATGIALWTYHPAKLYAVLWIVGMIYTNFFIFHKYRVALVVCILFCYVPFVVSEILLPTNRIDSLLFFRHPLFIYAIESGRNLGGSPLIYNRYVYGVYELIRTTLVYFSPQMMTINGDANLRFGFPGMGPISLVTYIGFWFGISRIFISNWRRGLMVLFLLVFSLIPAVLVWQKNSITRSLLMSMGWILLAGYGWDGCIGFMKKTLLTLAGATHARILSTSILVLVVLLHMNQDVQSWDKYYQSYLGQKVADYPWQAGSREFADFVWRAYPKYDHFVITKRHGQPYIYLLFYGKYDPKKYHPQAKRTAYIQFGFWENPGFDKFIFPDQMKVTPRKNTLYIVYPDEVPEELKSKAKPIRYNGRDVFYYFTYEPKST